MLSLLLAIIFLITAVVVSSLPFVYSTRFAQRMGKGKTKSMLEIFSAIYLLAWLPIGWFIFIGLVNLFIND